MKFFFFSFFFQIFSQEKLYNCDTNFTTAVQFISCLLNYTTILFLLIVLYRKRLALYLRSSSAIYHYTFISTAENMFFPYFASKGTAHKLIVIMCTGSPTQLGTINLIVNCFRAIIHVIVNSFVFARLPVKTSDMSRHRVYLEMNSSQLERLITSLYIYVARILLQHNRVAINCVVITLYSNL